MVDSWESDACERVKALPVKSIWADEDVEEEEIDSVRDSWEDDDFIKDLEVKDEDKLYKVDNVYGTVKQQQHLAEDNEATSFTKANDLGADSSDTGLKPFPLEGGETYAPDVDELSRGLNSGIKPGCLIGKKWICPNCWLIYHGSKNLIADMQELECCVCKMKNPTSYAWTLTRCTLNDISLDFTDVYNQGDDPMCVVYAFIALCDMSRRIRGAKHGCDEGMELSVGLMYLNFQHLSGYELGNFPSEYSEPGCIKGGEDPVIELMLKAAHRYGVPYTWTHYCRDYDMPGKRGDVSPHTSRSLEISSWFRIDCRDVEKIVRLLAHGFPLLAVVPVGKLFRFLNGGEVYCAPCPEGCGTHAIVLHGSGVAMPNADIRVTKSGESTQCEVFLKARNSHEDAHPTYEKEGRGSDFNIWAVHLYGDVYGINLVELYGAR